MAYVPKKYWTNLADRFQSADSFGFAPVLHPGAPAWFNQLIDRMQFQAVRRAITAAALPSGARILDVGCGTGRWLRRFRQMGMKPVGVDVTFGMLRWAHNEQQTDQLVAGMAQNLPFADDSFDCVSDITVVQHIPKEVQTQAIREMIRVLKPGGSLILLELIQGKDNHIFPRSAADWIKQAESCGVTLMRWFGQEFLLLDRAFVRLVQSMRDGSSPQAQPESQFVSSTPSRGLSVRDIYWRVRHFIAASSSWTESICAMVCPGSLANHGVFVFRK